jgi:hypothetical protein
MAVAAIASLALAMTLVSGVVAGSGSVTVRLTLQGDIDAADAFALLVFPAGSQTAPERGFFCGPPVEDFVYNEDPPVCAAGQNEISLTFPIQTELTLTFVRYDDFTGQPDQQPQELYSTSVTVETSPQVRFLVFDANGLPDTALATAGHPPAVVLFGVVLVAPAVAWVLLSSQSRRITGR